MSQEEETNVDMERFQAALKCLAERHYALPQQQRLQNVFNSVLAQFLVARSDGNQEEGRGLVLLGGTRSGKSHSVKELCKGFAAQETPLGSSFERTVLRISVRPGMTWRHLGSALLTALRFPSDLSHRSSDQIWTRVEGLLERKGIFIICFDEFQHIAHQKKAVEILAILDSLKDLMKRPEWPILPIVTGVPRLLDTLNLSPELTALLEPEKFDDINYDDVSIEEIDGIVMQYADLAKVDVSRIREEEIYRRMIHATSRRWGRLIELVIHTLAFSQVEGRSDIDSLSLAKTFRRWTGASDGANPFLVSNPYRIDVAKLFPI